MTLVKSLDLKIYQNYKPILCTYTCNVYAAKVYMFVTYEESYR